MIPKILHFIWMQGRNALPLEYRKCVESWAPLHPTWDIKIWSRDTLPELENDWVWEVDNPTIQADIARIEVVYRMGGVYMDADMECFRPIDDLLDGRDAFASSRNKLTIENAGFGAIAGHPWLRALICRLSADRSRIHHVLDVDKPFNEVTRDHKIEVFPLGVFHASDNERDRLEFHSTAYAIHHRLRRWMKDDERYAARYAEWEAAK